MKKMVKRIMLCSLVAALCWSAVLITDRKKLGQGLIRFHVVANSDSPEDQKIKLTIRDLVLSNIQDDLRKIADVEEAKAYLLENLPKIQNLVDNALTELGFDGRSAVTICKEAFDVRQYDTFSLPAGVYNSLRIVIGEGNGKNWWCISFPTLCLPATTSGFEDLAVSMGFSESLTKTLSGDQGYEIHFYLLNQLGKLENIFFPEKIIPCHLD